MRFQGASGYVATDDIKIAVNAAMTLEKPLLVKGEPGTGKTALAAEIAKAISAPLLEWHVKSTTEAAHGLYQYDAVRACATASSAIRGSPTSRTTSARARYGPPSRRRPARCC